MTSRRELIVANPTLGLPKLTYRGWSSFELNTGSGTLHFDPFYRKIFHESYSTLQDYSDARLILVSHGHGDHCIDVPSIAKLTGARIIAPLEVCEHFLKKSQIPKGQLIVAEPFKEIATPAFKITPFAWGHKEGKMSTLIKTLILKGSVIPAIRYGWMNLVEAPFKAPAFGFHVETDEGLRVLNYGEAFTDDTKFGNVELVGERLKTDVLIAGAQLNWQEFLAKGAAITRPKVVILHSPHELVERAAGVPALPPDTYVQSVKRALPHAEVQWVPPGSSVGLRVSC
jgi:ribonuclease BN (tRNA processing enzyme)